MEYKNYIIDECEFGYMVVYCGDEIVFDSIQDATEFIDEIEC